MVLLLAAAMLSAELYEGAGAEAASSWIQSMVRVPLQNPEMLMACFPWDDLITLQESEQAEATCLQRHRL